jgi:UDPglucose--hexose-1-phosphate uridylyltransferase
VLKTSTRLADGRELIYFDECPVERDVPDLRELPQVTVTSEARFDPLLSEWVVIASHRQGRTHLPPDSECPLCPSGPERATEVPADDYDVVVFENRFPSLAGGSGRCEVVCFSSDHEASFADLSPARARTVVDVWADRTEALSARPEVAQVFAFENRGAEIGVTLSHPHGQVYGYPFVTPRTEQVLASARRHREQTGRNLYDDVLQAEREIGTRVVASSEHWTAYVPAAARWPVEVHLTPHRRVPDLVGTTAEERGDFADLYLDVLRRIDGLYDLPMPYIAAWHQAPVREGRDLLSLQMQVFSTRRAPGKLKHLAGSESGMGVWINDIAPERMAQQLREVRL